jgi:hypothetical protein
VKRLWPANLLLVAGIVFLAWRTWTYPDRESTPAAPEPVAAEETSAAAPEVPTPPGPPPREQYQVIVAKNLFTASRSPAPPPPATVAAVAPVVPVENPQDRYILYGVVWLEGGKSFAIVKDKKTPNAKPRSYAVGDVLGGGHAVRAINSTRVVIASAGRETELRLRSPKGAEDTGFVPRPVTPSSPVPAAGVQPPMPQGGMKTPVQQIQRPGVRQPQPVPQPARRTPVPRPPAAIDEDEEDMDDMGDDEYFDEDEFDEDEFDDEDE